MLGLTTEEMEGRIEDDDIILPGFRFHPTDEELVGFYLRRKVCHKPISIQLIKQLDIYKFDPWDLPMVASGGEKEWYFYCPRDRKYRNSARPNRVTEAGFWKATGTDRPIYSSDGGSKCIGLKKSLVFYKGRAARGTKTDWMMHEFRLPSLSSNKFSDKNIPPNEAWAICRIFKKANSNAQRALSRSWISPLSDSTTISNTMNPFAISNTTTFCNDTQQLSTWPLHVVHANAGYTGTISNEPACTVSINDASSLLLDMSSSVLGGDVRGSGSAGFNVLPEPCNGQDDEWGLMKDAWRSSLVWDSSPCPSEFSTTYSTSNCNS